MKLFLQMIMSRSSICAVPAAYRRGRQLKQERDSHPAEQQRETSQHRKVRFRQTKHYEKT